jgi:hypothetical protein
MEATSQISGLRERFDATVALDGMSFTVAPGEVTGFPIAPLASAAVLSVVATPTLATACRRPPSGDGTPGRTS